MGLVLEFLIATNLLVIIVKCTNCSSILVLQFLPSQLLVPSSARYRLEPNCFYTADSVQSMSSKAVLKDRTEISFQWHSTFRNFQPQIPACHALLPAGDFYTFLTVSYKIICILFWERSKWQLFPTPVCDINCLQGKNIQLFRSPVCCIGDTVPTSLSSSSIIWK